MHHDRPRAYAPRRWRRSRERSRPVPTPGRAKLRRFPSSESLDRIPALRLGLPYPAMFQGLSGRNPTSLYAKVLLEGVAVLSQLKKPIHGWGGGRFNVLVESLGRVLLNLALLGMPI